MLNFLPGSKSYIVGLLLVAKGVAGYLWPDVAPGDPNQDVLMGMGILGLRKAIPSAK